MSVSYSYDHIIISNIIYAQMSFALLWKECLSYFTVTIPGLMEFNVTTPDIESSSANFTVSLNDSMVDVCTPRQAIFNGSALENSIKVDIQLPSGKLGNMLIAHQVGVFQSSDVTTLPLIDCLTGSTPYGTILVTRPTVPPVPLPSATIIPTIDPPHTDTAPDKSSTDNVPVIISGNELCS